jgi:hypothetical protein
MDEVVRIVPVAGEPGLIAFEVPQLHVRDERASAA